MRSQTIDPATVPGWGIDADVENDPTYPMRDRSQDDGLRSDWPRPDLQGQGVEVLQSIEHKRRPAVFGTSTPPSGLSGMIRRAAFGYSESHWLHWLMLMGADRINMVEGIVEDLAHGHVPNIPGEMGIAAAWKHDRSGTAIKVAAVAAVAAAAVVLLAPRSSPVPERQRTRQRLQRRPTAQAAAEARPVAVLN